VLANAWMSGPADNAILSDLPYEERWASATRMLGVDPDRLMRQAGNARAARAILDGWMAGARLEG